MSKSLILDWQKNSLMLARAHGRVPRAVIESVSIKPYGSGDASLQTANEALRAAAQELSAKGETTVLVARDMVELRTVQIPKMDQDDLPDVIRFQAQRQFANMSDAWTVDYVMLPSAAGAELQTALVAAISPAQLSEIESACSSAGLQISTIALRPLQIVQMAIESGQSPSTGRTMVVCVSESTMDILILRDGKVLQVRSTKLPYEAELVSGALQGEVRRSLLAASTDLENKPVDCVLLVSSAARAEALLAPLRQTGGANVVSLHTDTLLSSSDPNLADTAGARLAAVAGALSLKSNDRASSIDFKNPKRRPPKKSNSRTWVLAAGAAAVLLVGSVSWYYSTISELDNDYEAIQQEIAALKKEGESAKTRLASYTAIQRFAAGSPNWLDELSTISQKIPSAEKVMFENPTFSLNVRGGTGVIDVGVKSKDTESISKVVQSLNNDGYEVRNTNTQQLNKEEGIYKFLGTVKMELRNRGWDISSARSDETKPAIGTVSKPAESTEDSQTDKEDKADKSGTEQADKPEEEVKAEVNKPAPPVATAPSIAAPKSEAPKPEVPEKAETPSPTQPALPPAATPPAPVLPPNAPTPLEPAPQFAPTADPFGGPAPAPTQPDTPPVSGN